MASYKCNTMLTKITREHKGKGHPTNKNNI